MSTILRECRLQRRARRHRRIKEQRVVRFIGITGHNDGAAMAEALRRYDFDTVMMALNAAQSANPIAQRKMEPIPAFENPHCRWHCKETSACCR